MPPLIMFDLDQTLAESKQPLTPQVANLIARLLEYTKVAVISGGALPQFLKQVVEQLPARVSLNNLYLLPTSGAALYEWHSGEWHKVYEEKLSKEEELRIDEAIKKTLQETNVIDLSTPAFGERIEHRGSQISLSALGQQAPIDLKKAWDPDKSKRHTLQTSLAARLPEFSVAMGGATTIDITKKGIDKAYGIEKLAHHLHLKVADGLYIGDELIPGGNDEAATRTAIKTHAVTNPIQTAFFICSILPKA